MARRFNFQTGQWESYQSDFDKSISKSKIKPGQAEKPKPQPTVNKGDNVKSQRDREKELHGLIQQGLSLKDAKRQLRISGLEPALAQKKEAEAKEKGRAERTEKVESLMDLREDPQERESPITAREILDLIRKPFGDEEVAGGAIPFSPASGAVGALETAGIFSERIVQAEAGAAITAGVTADTLAAATQTKNFIKLAIGGGVLSLIERRASTLGTAASQQTERIEKILQGARAGVPPETVIAQLGDIRKNLNKYDQALQIGKIYTPSLLFGGKTENIENDLAKGFDSLDAADRTLLIIAASPPVSNVAELQSIEQELKGGA